MLAGYPLYDVPNKRAENILPEEKIKENFSYFMDVRKDRLAIVQEWMRDSFKIDLPMNGQGIYALEKWIKDFGGGLIDDNPQAMRIFMSYSPNWIDAFAGYNVLMDIGIFLGEYLIRQRPVLFWEINRPQLNEEGVFTGVYIGRPVLRGFPKTSEWSHNTFQQSYGQIADSRKRAHFSAIQTRRHYMETLSYSMKAALHMASLPAGDYVHIFGDYRDEPL